MISNKRYRVTKQFYKSLNDYAKIVVGIGGTLRKKQCNKINEIITTPLTWVDNKSKVCNSIFATLPVYSKLLRAFFRIWVGLTSCFATTIRR